MNKTGQILSKELEMVLSGDAWYGLPVVTILESIQENNTSRRVTEEHTMGEILLHMTVWTSEVINRLKGQEAGEPELGDWPDPEEFSWKELKDMFMLVNGELIAVIGQVSEDRWEEPVIDHRSSRDEAPVSNLELVRGIIQHHIYHSAQISILNRQLGTL